MRLDAPYLNQLPIPDVPRTTDDGTVSQADIAAVVEDLEATKRELEAREYDLESAAEGYLEIQASFDDARRRLEAYVCEAYGLTTDQREVIQDLHG